MTKTIISWGTALLMLCSGLLTSCNNDEGGGEPPVPSVTIAAGNASSTTLQFTLTLRDADKCTYLCTPKADPAPTADQILSGGKTITASGTVTIDQLTSNTAYRLSAVAAQGNVYGTIAEADHATSLQPAVTLTAGTATETELKFTAALADSEAAAYLCIEKTADAVVPTAEAILTEGTSIAQSGEVTVDGLTKSTAYLIAAAAKNGDIFSQVDVIEMTTDGPIRFTTQAAGGYYGKPENGSYGEYRFVLANGPTAEVDGVHATVEAGMAMSFDCFQMIPLNLASISFPARTYRYGTNKGISTFHPDGTFCMVNDGKGNLSKIEFKAGTITVLQSGANYTFTIELTTTSDQPFSAIYTGPIAVPDQTSEEPEKLPDLEIDVTNLDFIRAIAKYYSGSDGAADNCIVHLYDVQPGGLDYGSDYLPGAGHMVSLDLWTATSAEPNIQTGTYTLSANNVPGTYAPGFQTSFMDTMLALGTYCEKRNDENQSVYGFVNAGTVTVTKKGDNYRFEFELTTDKSKKISGTYEGPVEMTDKRN